MPEIFLLILCFTLSFAVVSLSIPKIIMVANQKKLFDVPDHRKVHKAKIIPNLGGVGIFAGIFIGTIIAIKGYDANKIIGYLLAALIMFLMGLKDDIIGLSALKKLGGQIIVSLYLILCCNIRFTNLHGIFGINEISYSLSVLISLITIIGIINALNLIDGIDGLASGIGTLISFCYGSLFLYFGETELAILSFSIAGSLVSFFFYNVFGQTNKIFMGDTGSLTLGVLLAILTIAFNEISPTKGTNNLSWTYPVISLSIMIVPIIDTVRVIFVRLFQRRSPLSADMNHIHHLLLKITKGNHLQATIIIIFANAMIISLCFGLIKIIDKSILFVLVLCVGFSAAYLTSLISKQITKASKSRMEEENKHLYIIKPKPQTGTEG